MDHNDIQIFVPKGVFSTIGNGVPDVDFISKFFFILENEFLSLLEVLQSLVIHTSYIPVI